MLPPEVHRPYPQTFLNVQHAIQPPPPGWICVFPLPMVFSTSPLLESRDFVSLFELATHLPTHETWSPLERCPVWRGGGSVGKKEEKRRDEAKENKPRSKIKMIQVITQIIKTIEFKNILTQNNTWEVGCNQVGEYKLGGCQGSPGRSGQHNSSHGSGVTRGNVLIL